MLTDRQIQMLTKKGFVALFWKEYSEQMKKDPSVTHEQVYELLENEYQKGTGQRRYANFKSFRTRRDE
jgi:hypothetical protein